MRDRRRCEPADKARRDKTRPPFDQSGAAGFHDVARTVFATQPGGRAASWLVSMARTRAPRLITQAEAAVVRTALERAPSTSPTTRVVVPVNELMVVGRCECGCDSVDFVPSEGERSSRPFAH